MEASLACVSHGLQLCYNDDGVITSYNSLYTSTMASITTEFCAVGAGKQHCHYDIMIGENILKNIVWYNEQETIQNNIKCRYRRPTLSLLM